MEEKMFWEGEPSQLANGKAYAVSLLFCWLVIPVFIAWLRYRETSQMQYFISEKGACVSHPNANKFNRLLEMYRIKDISFSQPAYYKPFGLFDVTIHPMEEMTKPVVFHAVRFPVDVKDRVLKIAQEKRQVKKVKEFRIPILQ